MPSLTAIQNEITELVIDNTAYVSARVVEAVQRAQEVLEDRHNWIGMRAEAGPYITATDTRLLVTPKPADWKEPRERPYRVDGTGHSQEIRWMQTDQERVKRYNPDDPLDRGAPRHILENDSGGFDVYPLPDGLAPSGPVFSDGQWRIVIPYWKRLPQLSSGPDENWFTDNCKQFLVFHAVGELLYGNRDHQEAALYLIPGPRMGGRAGAELSRLIRRDKIQQVAQKPLFVPRTGANASIEEVRG